MRLCHIHELKLATNCVCSRKTLIQVHTLELCRWAWSGRQLCFVSLVQKSVANTAFRLTPPSLQQMLIYGAVFCSYRSIGSTPCLRTLFALFFDAQTPNKEIDKPYLGHDTTRIYSVPLQIIHNHVHY